MKHHCLLLLCILILGTSVLFAQGNDLQISRLKEITDSLNAVLFVNRFESVETPCLYIDSSNNSLAHVQRRVINSNYRIRLRNNGVPDSVGVKCLSQYCSRYLRLKVDSVNAATMQINGSVQSTYAYPASSLIQYLGFAQNQVNKTDAFFQNFYRSSGRFWLYVEDNEYRIRMVLSDGPFDGKDTVYGHLEIVREGFRDSSRKSFSIYFSEMALHKGDHNNQIALHFSSTNFQCESEYFSMLAYNVLKNKNSPDIFESADALWLDNFLKNPACPQCVPVYKTALSRVKAKGFRLPNTEPLPPLH